MDGCTPGQPCASHGNITLNGTDTTVPEIRMAVTRMLSSFCHTKGQGQVAPPRYLSGDSEWDPVVVWQKSLAVASTEVAAPLQLGFPGRGGDSAPGDCQPQSP